MVQDEEVDVPVLCFSALEGLRAEGGITDFLSFHNGEKPVLGETVQSGGRCGLRPLHG